MTTSKFYAVLDQLEGKATMGGSGSEFLAAAFVSWYRPGDSRKRDKVNLYNFTRLDPANRQLFVDMLQMRDGGNFDDQALFALEQTIKKYWGWK